jgi:hypothetical protein
MGQVYRLIDRITKNGTPLKIPVIIHILNETGLAQKVTGKTQNQQKERQVPESCHHHLMY